MECTEEEERGPHWYDYVAEYYIQQRQRERERERVST